MTNASLFIGVRKWGVTKTDIEGFWLWMALEQYLLFEKFRITNCNGQFQDVSSKNHVGQKVSVTFFIEVFFLVLSLCLGNHCTETPARRRDKTVWKVVTENVTKFVKKRKKYSPELNQKKLIFSANYQVYWISRFYGSNSISRLFSEHEPRRVEKHTLALWKNPF